MHGTTAHLDIATSTADTKRHTARRTPRRALGRKVAAVGFALAMAATPGIIAAPAANAQPVGMSINLNPEDWVAGAGSVFGSADMIGRIAQDPGGFITGSAETTNHIVGCIIADSLGALPQECMF